MKKRTFATFSLLTTAAFAALLSTAAGKASDAALSQSHYAASPYTAAVAAGANTNPASVLQGGGGDLQKHPV